jgi:BspA type Leucine rich repeat region (6 copies)
MNPKLIGRDDLLVVRGRAAARPYRNRKLPPLVPRLLLAALISLALPATLQAQFTYTNIYGVWSYATNTGSITIMAFAGSGNVTVPNVIPIKIPLPPPFPGYTTTNWPVTSIGDGAFSEWFSGLNDLPTSVTIPGSVTNIGNYVFEEALSLTNLVIGAGVASIGTGAFQWTYGLIAITVNSTNSTYSSAGGVLFNKVQTTIVQYPTGSQAGSYVIPNSVTNVGTLAFFLSPYLTNVVLPNGAVSIGDQAFENCSILSSVNIPNSVTTIGNASFESCGALNTVSIPNSVISIGMAAFEASGVTSVSIPKSVTSISSQLFDICENLTNVVIPNGVTNIGYLAFYNCGALANVVIPNHVSNIGGSAFSHCFNLSSVYFAGNSPLPTNDLSVFQYDNNATVYYLADTMGWGSTFDGIPAMLWNPQAQVGDAPFGALTNQFGFNITGTTNIPIVVEACTNLSGTWTALLTGTVTNGSIYFSDPQWTNYPGRFYRIRSP